MEEGSLTQNQESQVSSATVSDSVLPTSSRNNSPSEKRIAYKVTIYHVAVFVAVGLINLALHLGWIPADDGLKKVIYSLCFGAMGGTLTASRYVVYAVRHRDYDTERVLWQVLTPIHSAVLATICILTVRAGLITLTNAAAPTEPQYTWFVMSFSFLVGLASEAFVKRLIMAAESLLGERGDLERHSLNELEKEKKN